MDEVEWKAKAADVVLRMREFTTPYVCPISYDDGQVRLLGSGSFIDLLGKKFLLSNEHVLARGHPVVSHGIYGTDDVFRCQGLHLETAGPDLCIFDVDAAWGHDHRGRALLDTQIAPFHRPVEDEIIFFKGYAKENHRFLFDTLLSGATSYATQIRKDPPQGFDTAGSFLLHHNPEMAVMLDGNRNMPLPPGFSGSTVWNTRYVECTSAGREWKPEYATVTGVVCRWTTGDPGINVVKVDRLRGWLLSVLQGLSVDGVLTTSWVGKRP